MSSHEEDTNIPPLVSALVNAFRQLRQFNWRGRSPVEGYTASEMMMLFCIRRNPAIKSSEISRLMHITQPTVSQTVNLLVARGALTRTQDPDDRRSVRISLTKEGMQITEAARASMNESFRGLVDHLGDERTQQLIDLLGDVQAYYQAQAADDGSPDCKNTP